MSVTWVEIVSLHLSVVFPRVAWFATIISGHCSTTGAAPVRGRDGHLKMNCLRPRGLISAEPPEPTLSPGSHGREGHQQTAKRIAAPCKQGTSHKGGFGGPGFVCFTTQAEPGPEKTWVKPIKTHVLNCPAHCNLVANQYFSFKNVLWMIFQVTFILKILIPVYKWIPSHRYHHELIP